MPRTSPKSVPWELYQCPTEPRFKGDVLGCGYDEIVARDDTKRCECPACGLTFDPIETPVSVRKIKEPELYDVTLYLTVRVKLKDISALSHIKAIERANKVFDPWSDLHLDVTKPHNHASYAEFSEEWTGALVDEAKERDEFHHSDSFRPSDPYMTGGTNWARDYYVCAGVNFGRRAREKRDRDG